MPNPTPSHRCKIRSDSLVGQILKSLQNSRFPINFRLCELLWVKQLVSFHLLSTFLCSFFFTPVSLCLCSLYFSCARRVAFFLRFPLVRPFLRVQCRPQRPRWHSDSRHTFRRDKSILFRAKNKHLVEAHLAKAARSFLSLTPISYQNQHSPSR